MINIKSNQHLFIAGRTRSGKTVLIRTLLPSLPRVIYHDRKFENADLLTSYHFSLCNNPSEVIQALNNNIKRILYQPHNPDNSDFDELCKIVFNVGNITLVCDESAALFEVHKAPLWAKELIRLGSQRGIGVWLLTQRPRGIDNVCISESTYIISFRLNMKPDRDKIVETCGSEVQEPLRTLPLYHFMFFDGIENEVHWCNPLPFTKKQ